METYIWYNYIYTILYKGVNILRKILVAILITLLTVFIIAGCQITTSITVEEEVELSSVDYINDISDNIISVEDFAEVNWQGEVQPTVSLYSFFYVKEGVDTVVTDRQVDEENGFAYVDVNVTINGRIEYYDGLEQVDQKDADISGTAYLELEKRGEQWVVIDRDINFSTVDSGLTINEPSLLPEPPLPVIAGNALEVTCNIDSEHDKSFGVLVASRASYSLDFILDYSQSYTFGLDIRDDISAGTYGGFIKTVVWGSIVDPEEPIELNIKSFEFEVVEGDK